MEEKSGGEAEREEGWGGQLELTGSPGLEWGTLGVAGASTAASQVWGAEALSQSLGSQPTSQL